MSKILNAAAFATGYVLGTRAGRSRYEQIVRTAQRVREDAPDLASQVADQAKSATSGTSGGSSSSSSSSTSGSSSSGGSGTDAAASTPMYSAPTPGAGAAPDDAGSSDDEAAASTTAQTPMYSAPTPDSGTAPEGGAHAADRPTDAPGAGTEPVPPVGHTDVEEEVVYSSGPDIETPIEELTEDDPR